MRTLLGRDPELQVLGDLVDGVAAGVPRALVVVGEEGIGKSALLDAAAERARGLGVRVLRADGCRAETDTPGAALSQLLGEVADLAAGLPDDQQRAVASVLGVGAGPSPADRGALQAGTLRLLRALGERGPVLVLVDDADRLDVTSLHALLFVARRLRVCRRVGVVLAGRGDHRPLPGDASLPTMELAPLDPAAATALLERSPRPPTGRARDDVLAGAGGNPLALLELGAAGSDRPVIASGAAVSRFAERLRGLPAATRRLLLHAAAGEGESLATLQTATGASGLGDWAPAERVGLIAVDGVRVVFRHPVARAAAYAVATAQERRAAHLALAAAGDEPDRIAWHRAHACPGTDEGVAGELAERARAAATAGRHRAAARAWQRAAECSPGPAMRVERHHEALRAAYAAGDASWVGDQHRVLRELTDDPVIRVRSTLLHAAALMMRARYRDAVRALHEVVPYLDRVDDGAVVLLVGFAVVAADESGVPEHHAVADAVAAHPRLAAAAETVSSTATSPADLLWLRGGVALDRPAAAAALREAEQAGRTGPPAGADDLTNLGLLADRADEIRAAIDLLQRSQALMHHEGPAAWSAGVLVGLLVEHGRWTAADEMIAVLGPLAASRRTTRLAVEIAASRAVLLAQRGDAADAHRVLAAARADVDLSENRMLDLRLRDAAATVATTAGDHTQAYRQLRGAFAPDGRPHHLVHSPRLVARLAAAAGAAGEREDAARVLAGVRAALGDRGSARTRRLLHHAEALLGPEQDVEHHFRLAVADPTGEDWPVERAEARLHYGRWLRRRRRPLEAREVLAAALETFESLGALAPADRVRAELRAAGSAEQVEREVETDPLAALTPQQREIVRLAADGLRNREIGERLFLSPRTVGSHLHHAYPKLGISGRHQLASLLREA
jgi:DNA-binding CsgD family transcriptional regulator